MGNLNYNGLAYGDYQRTRPMRWWHEAIIDDMLAFPLSSNAERGKRLGYSREYIGMLTNSDMFRAAYAARRKMFSERLDATLVHKTAQVAEKGLDILLEQLEKKRDFLPFAAVSDAIIGPSGALARLGYGAPKPSATNITVNANQQVAMPQVSQESLAEARGRLRLVEQKSLPSPLQPSDSRGEVSAAHVLTEGGNPESSDA